MFYKIMNIVLPIVMFTLWVFGDLDDVFVRFGLGFTIGWCAVTLLMKSIFVIYED